MISLTYFEGRNVPHGRRFRMTWTELLERLMVPRVSAVKEVPGLSLATYREDRRALANVEHVYALGLDLDTRVSWAEVRSRFSKSASFVHSTWSSTLFEPRARVFVLLSRPVTSNEYRSIYRALVTKLEAAGLVVDRAASDASRFWFLPAIRPGAPFTYYVGDGGPVDVEAALAAAPPPPAAPSVPPPSSSRLRVGGGPSAVDRARAYLAKCEPGISGSGGSATTLKAAICMARGFALSEADAFSLMVGEYNPRCQPPWSERDLQKKIADAARLEHFPLGFLLERERAR